LEGGPPSFTRDYTCPALLGIPLGVVHVGLPGFHRLWRTIPGRFGLVSYSHDAVPQPRRCKHPRFGLARFRSPLLSGSRLLSLPPGTEMFQFPGFASCLRRMTDLAAGRVAPFGNPGITASLQLPQAYRSLARPSSPPCAKASTVRPYALDLVASRCDSSNTTHLTNVSCQRTKQISNIQDPMTNCEIRNSILDIRHLADRA
jgi:hypothetical protein